MASNLAADSKLWGHKFMKKHMQNIPESVQRIYRKISKKMIHIKELWNTFKQEEKELKAGKPTHNREREFLPASLEIQETPASPIGRFLIWFLCGFFTLAILWATFGKVDIVAVGQGQIIASGNTKIVQPLETGVISEILIKEGMRVNAGDTLIKMDITETGAEKARLENDLNIAKADSIRLRATLENAPAVFPDTLPESLITNQFSLMAAHKEEERAKVASLLSSIEQKKAEVRATESQIEKLEATVPLIRQREKIISDLVKKGVEAKINAIAIKEQRIEQENELKTQKERLNETTAALAAVEEQLLATESEFKRALLKELTEAEQLASTLEKELSKANNKVQLQTLKSPISGTVQELMVHTIGGVVTPAQELLKVVPEQATLEANLFIQNKDIGFIEEGQKVALKLEAFPFTKYGMIDGEVTHVSHDAIQDEELGLVFKAKVKMLEDHIMVRDKQIRLTPGMSLSGEIKTGDRRIIEYFLSPILKYQAEVIRER